MAADTDRLAEIQARDSRTLATAPASSDDWDDATWAAWSRCADRAHTGGGEGELARLRAENLELHAQLAIREEQVAGIDQRYGAVHEARDLWRSGDIDADDAMQRIHDALGTPAIPGKAA